MNPTPTQEKTDLRTRRQDLFLVTWFIPNYKWTGQELNPTLRGEAWPGQGTVVWFKLHSSGGGFLR